VSINFNALMGSSLGVTSNAGGYASASTNASSSGAVDQLTSATGGFELSTGDFLTLFLAQLKNQDPTQPMDDAQMLAQLAQMTEISTLQQVQASLAGTQLAQSSALIGRNVTGLDVNGDPVNGVVTSVTQSNDAGLVLQVGSQYIKPDKVVKVTQPSMSGTTGATA
jgi:flagellar basal-body rod modification protein FlgD